MRVIQTQVGKYNQTIKCNIIDGKVSVKIVTCDCFHGSNMPLNWKKGETICWHKKEALVIAKRKICQKKKLLKN